MTPPAPHHLPLRSMNRQLRKLQRAEELETELAELCKKGYLLVFTDGSSEGEPRVGRIASGTRVSNFFQVICAKQTMLLSFTQHYRR